MNKNKIFYILIIAIVIKLFLFAFAEFHAPESKIQPDSSSYLKPATILVTQGAFATKDENGVLKYELYRTPGYPLFLGILHDLMKIPFAGIVLLQIFLTLLAALITYKTAIKIDHKLGLLSAVIVLYSVPIAIFSLMILTTPLFLFFTSLFAYGFVAYLKDKKIKMVILSALILVVCTYIKPISYYLGVAMAVFIIYANIRENSKNGFIHALIFLSIVYSFLEIWQIRNYIHCGELSFSTIIQSNYTKLGLMHSYARNNDPTMQGLSPALFYIKATCRSLMSIMARPGTFKYFHSSTLTAIGKIVAYLWMLFWMAGFIFGIARTRRNIYLQSLLFMVLYFIVVSIAGIMLLVGERFRVPIIPFIAIISAYGWTELISMIRKRYKQIKILKITAAAIAGLLILASGFYFFWFSPRYAVPILTYHHFGYVKQSLYVSPENFDRQMHYLNNKGYNVISLDEFVVRGMKKQETFGQKTVVITVDDGYKDNFTYAYPVLKKYGFPATVFLIANYIGAKEDFMNWDQVREMSENNISFGGHTKNHVYLPGVKDKDILWDEIAGCKEIIEKHIKAPADYFCYPSGGFTEESKTFVKKAGYKGACTTNRGFDMLNRVDPYELDRIKVTNSDMNVPFSFRAKLSGYYNLFRKQKEGD